MMPPSLCYNFLTQKVLQFTSTVREGINSQFTSTVREGVNFLAYSGHKRRIRGGIVPLFYLGRI